jgi:hypothetical protein
MAGAITFGAQLDRKGLFAVARRFPADTGMKRAVGETVGEWRLPGQVRRAQDLPGGTWIFCEVDGAVSFRVAPALGYNFSWVRQLAAGALAGDVGLKLDLGLQASLRLLASGKYCLVLSRESEAPALRLRLFKLKQKGWDFAFNLKATAEPVVPDLPKDPDDFVLAMLGVHPAQAARDLVRGLRLLDQWTDPDIKPAELLAGLTAKEAVALLGRLASVGRAGKALEAFNEARRKVMTALETWHHLDSLAHGAAMKLLGRIVREEDLAAIAEIATAVTESDDAALARLLAKRLEDVDFFHSAAGQWLEAAAARGILQVLSDERFDELRKVAKATADVLDGSLVTDVIRRMQAEVEKPLAKIEEAIARANPELLGPWLQARLRSLFEKDLGLAELEELRRTVHALLSVRRQVYDKALKALEEKYEVELSGTFDTLTTREAAIDLEFDFSNSNWAPQVQDLLAKALDGDFGNLFLGAVPGVVVHRGRLSHGLRRQSHVEVSLPLVKASAHRLSESVATFDFEASNGRVYALDARDEVTRNTDRGRRASTLAIGAHLPLGDDGQIRRFDVDSLTYSYSYRESVADMQTRHLRYQLRAYLDAYFAARFDPTGRGQTSSETWISELDNTLDRLRVSTNRIGNTVLSLELAVAARTVAAWFNETPIERLDVRYLDLSKALQAALKRLVPFFYLRDAERFRAPAVVWPLLVYAAIPPLNGVQRSERGEIVPWPGDLHWWNRSKELVLAVAGWGRTQGRLGDLLRRARETITAAGLGSTGGYYDPATMSDDILRALVTNDAYAYDRLTGLLELESEIVRRSVEAGVTLARFRQRATQDVDGALQALESAGASLAATFNRRLGVYGGDESRPLATMLFVQGARALSPDGSGTTTARLHLTVLRDGVGLRPEFLDQTSIRPEDMALSQLITSTGVLTDPALAL